MPAFDAYVMVDWSAASAPKTGVDSIWIASARRVKGQMKPTRLVNPPTRQVATETIAATLEMLPKRSRVLVGFDFPFGYVRGTAGALGMDAPPWRQMWRRISADVRDDGFNRNNRFDVAETWNKSMTGEPFPFWGNVREEPRTHLLRKRFRRHNGTDLPERRLVEACIPTAQPVWKLAYAGSVGSQTILGIPRVWQLRNNPLFADQTAIWPFETGLKDSPGHRIILAEIYPSLIPPKDLKDKPKDAGQVAAMVDRLAELDAADQLVAFFKGDPSLEPEARSAVLAEEAWMLGVTGKGQYWQPSS